MYNKRIKQENPWDVSNIQEFLYFNCPECDTKVKDSEVFLQHAFDNHEMSKFYLTKDMLEFVSHDQDDIISDYEMEERKDQKPALEELNSSKDKNFMQLRLHKLKVEPEVLLDVQESAQDDDYIPYKSAKDDDYIPYKPAQDDDYNPESGNDSNGDDEDEFESESFPCDLCGKSYNTAHSLKNHIKYKHGGEEKCDQCDTVYPNRRSLDNHAHEKHFNSTSCEKCDYKCHSNYMLDSHIRLVHKVKYRYDVNSDGAFSCRICNFKTQNEKEMKDHQWEHKDIKWSYKCELCDATFINKCKFREHKEVVHMGALPFRCEQCDYRCKLKAQLKYHLKRVHEVGSSMHICTICGKSVVYLKLHMETMHPEKGEGATCDQCGLFFDSKSKLNSHKHYTHKRKFQVCTICSKFFIGLRKQKLIDHYTSEHGIFCNKKDIYVCGICQIKMTSQEELAEHYHTVHEVKDTFNCTKCVHAEPTNALLSLHYIDAHNLNPFNELNTVNEKTVQVHEDNLEYTCQICNKKLSSKVTLKNHIKCFHDTSNHVKCEQCPKTFNYPSELRKHVLQKHTAATKFPCDQCSFVTNFKSQLNTHIRKIHEKKYNHKCSACDKQFRLRKQLQEHMLNEHDILYKYQNTY